MGTRRVTLTLDVPDTYERLTQARLEVVEGTFRVNTASLEYAMVENISGDIDGVQLAAGAYLALGPITTPGSGWRLDELWFREVAAGAGATVSFVGTVREV